MLYPARAVAGRRTANLLPDTTVVGSGTTYTFGTHFDAAKRTTLTSGHWGFIWTPTAAFATGVHVLMQIGGAGHGIYMDSGSLNFQFPTGSGIVFALSGSLSSPISIDVDLPTGTVTIAGATTGNGGHSVGAARNWLASLTSIAVGDQVGGGLLTPGTYTNYLAA